MPLIDNHVLDGWADPAANQPPSRSGGGSRAVRALPHARACPPERIVRRAELLGESDRALFHLCVRENASLQGVSRALGVSAGTLSRRLQRIMARLGDPVVGALLDETCPLEPELRQVGVEHFLVGLSARDIADKHRLTPRQVAKMLEYVRGWHASTRRPARPRAGARPLNGANGTNGSHDDDDDDTPDGPAPHVKPPSPARARGPRAAAKGGGE